MKDKIKTHIGLGRARRLSPAQIQKLYTMHSEGYGCRRIAKSLGCDKNTVLYHLLSPEKHQRYIERNMQTKRVRAEKAYHLKLQEKAKSLTDFERGYISGFIDGEGCFGLTHLDGAHQHWLATLQITNTKKEVIDYFRSLLGNGTISYRVPKNPRHNNSWRITLSGDSLRWLLPSLQFTLKTRQSQIMLKALDLLKGHSNTGQHNTQLSTLREELQQLNRRGK